MKLQPQPKQSAQSILKRLTPNPLTLHVASSILIMANVNIAQAQVASGWNCQQVDGLWHCGASGSSNTDYIQKRSSAANYASPMAKKVAPTIPEAQFIAPMGPTGGTAVVLQKAQPNQAIATETWSNCAKKT